MQYPIAQVETSDHLWLYGLLLESKSSKTIFIHTHGTGSNFFEEYFIDILAPNLLESGISLLSFNNRGAGVYDAYQGSGAATELFEDCLKDFDAWIKFVINKGYKKIIFSGHSLGTEKIVYYLNRGKYRKKIDAIILLAPASSTGYHIYGDNYKPSKKDEKRVQALLKESKSLVRAGKGDVFLARDSYAGIMPKSAKSMINFLTSSSEINKALPFHEGHLTMYKKIAIPILALIGDKAEYTAIPPVEALRLMKKENHRTEVYQLKNCNHDFEGCEKKVTKMVSNFIQKHTK